MIYFYFLAACGFIFLQGFFCASEISFISSRLLKLRHRQDKGDVRAKKVYRLILVPEKFLATTLVGTNISVVLSSSFLTYFLIKVGVQNSNFWITVFFTPLVVIFAEMIPKNIGRYFKEDFSCKTVGIIIFFENVFAPVVGFIEILSKWLVKVFVGKARLRSPFVTKEEIRSLLKDIEKEGGIDKGEKEAIEEVFEFGSSKVKDVSVILKKVAALDYTDSFRRILDIVRKSGFTRYPVFRNKEIIGYVNIYDLFYNQDKHWHESIRPIAKVGLNQKLYEVFTRLKSKKESIALVLKGKRVWGIITLEDLIRETITSIIK